MTPIYLRHKSDLLLAQVISRMWADASASEKQVWFNKADAKKRAHALKYPGYTYQPRKSGQKKRRMTKAKRAAMAEASSITGDGSSSATDLNYIPNREFGYVGDDPEDNVANFWSPSTDIPNQVASFSDHPTNPEYRILNINTTNQNVLNELHLLLENTNNNGFAASMGVTNGPAALTVAPALESRAEYLADYQTTFGDIELEPFTIEELIDDDFLKFNDDTTGGLAGVTGAANGNNTGMNPKKPSMNAGSIPHVQHFLGVNTSAGYAEQYINLGLESDALNWEMFN